MKELTKIEEILLWAIAELEDGRLALREAYQLNRKMWTAFGKRFSEFGQL